MDGQGENQLERLKQIRRIGNRLGGRRIVDKPIEHSSGVGVLWYSEDGALPSLWKSVEQFNFFFLFIFIGF